MEGRDLLDKVSFLNKHSLLAKATSDCQKPTPGHMYETISKITYESGSLCLSTLEYLLKRLEKKSPHVKLKALKIIHHLVSHGHNEFRYFLRRRDAQIKDAISFSGPPDALQGISSYVAVRKEAMEILKLLYDPDLMNNDAQVDKIKTVKETHMAGMGSSANSSSKYMGFGNSPTINKSIAERAVDSLVGIVDKFLRYPPDTDASSLNSDVGNYKPAKVFNDSPVLTVDEPSVPVSMPSTSSTRVAAASAAFTAVAVPVIASSRHKKTSNVHRPGRAGGGWDDPLDETNASGESSLSVSIQDQESLQSTSLSSDSLDHSKDEDAIPDFKKERDFVKGVSEESSQTFTSFHLIHQIIHQWLDVNWEKVMELFAELLQDDCASRQMRILLFVEVLIYQNILSAKSVQATLNSSLLQLKQSSVQTLQAKAQKLLLILKIANSGDQGCSSNSNVQIVNHELEANENKASHKHFEEIQDQ